MTTPPPLPERPLVEAYGVRAADESLFGTMWFNAEQAQRTAIAFDGATVVPLIAADRLEADELRLLVAYVVLDNFNPPDDKHSTWWIAPGVTATAVLAALRTHLERP